jgi:hypothetical protein
MTSIIKTAIRCAVWSAIVVVGLLIVSVIQRYLVPSVLRPAAVDRCDVRNSRVAHQLRHAYLGPRRGPGHQPGGARVAATDRARVMVDVAPDEIDRGKT